MTLNPAPLASPRVVEKKILMPRPHPGPIRLESLCVRPRPQNFYKSSPTIQMCAARVGCIHRFGGYKPPKIAGKFLHA